MYDIFSLDLVMVGIFGIARCNSIWPILWACFVPMCPGPLLWFLLCVWCRWFFVAVPMYDIFSLDLVMGGRGNPVAISLAYVVGLLCGYVPLSLVMVSALCLVSLVLCCGSDV